MRDRLIEILRKPMPVIKGYATIGETRMSIVDAEHIAGRLLAEGVIVPKVKIGDKLWAINAAQTRVNEYEVTHLEVYDCGIKIFGRQIYCREEYWLCWCQDLGNDESCVFLTREEAEKALERSENGKS